LNAKNAPLLLVGTHCESINHTEVTNISNKIKEIVVEFEDARFVYTDELYFFPVENKLKEKNELYLEPIKQRVGQILAGEQTQVGLESFQQQVKSSWVFLMDILVDENKSLLSLSRVYEIGESFGMSPESIEKMLNFYNETGTIVYFGKDIFSAEDDNDKNFVIINPQWLLNCLGCIMYDVEFHGSNGTKVDSKLNTAVDQLELNGLLSRKLFLRLLSHVSEQERDFIEHLCLRKNLMSKFIFKTGEKDENPSIDSNKFLIPVMIKNIEEKIRAPKGHKIEWNNCIFW